MKTMPNLVKVLFFYIFTFHFVLLLSLSFELFGCAIATNTEKRESSNPNGSCVVKNKLKKKNMNKKVANKKKRGTDQLDTNITEHTSNLIY